MSSAVEVPMAPDDVVEAFVGLLIQEGRPHLVLGDALRAWDAADRGWAASAAGRLRLAEALDRLGANGVIDLPSRRGTQWTVDLPRLPLRIGIPANRRLPGRTLDAADEPWVPALGWAGSWIRSTRPPQRLRLSLVSINRWMARNLGNSPPIICREERSLQVFEDEKALSQLANTALFEAGRLTLESLSCETPVGGIRIARLAEAGPVLVVENKATFDSAWRALRRRRAAGEASTYAAIVFGSGDEAGALVPDLVALEDLAGVRASRFEYAGDLDVAGVAAAGFFIEVAHGRGLDARPAHRLWEALGAAAPAGDDLTGDERERGWALSTAERIGLPASVVTRIREGVRVPQERLDRVRFADISWWAD